MTDTIERDYLILGAGPAGLQLAYFLKQAGRSYAVLERGTSPGTFFKQFPRHRMLISVNKVYTGHCDTEMNLRWDWNSLLTDDDRLQFRNYSKKYFPGADDMVRYLEDFASLQQLDVHCNVDISTVSRTGAGNGSNGKFELVDRQNRRYLGRRLIVATGVSKPNIPAIPGIELVEQYADVSVRPEDFTNQRVLIIGKANSAFETADNLIDTTALIHVASPRPVNFAWQSHFVGHLRAVNNNLLDTYLLKCQNATLEVEISKIEKRGERYAVRVEFLRAPGSGDTIEYDRVICCTGFRFDSELFDASCRPELVINNRFPSQTSAWESTNVPDMYFAGTLMQARDFKKTTSGFIHGFRYNVRALAQILEERYQNNPIPSRMIGGSPRDLTEAVLARINRSSALWQQFGFLGDCIIRENGQATYLEGLPVKYIHDSHLGQHDDYYVVTLEYGTPPDHDPFKSMRVSHTNLVTASDSTFLHPIVRRYCRGKLVSEHHVVENLEAIWTDDSLHRAPLATYFSASERQPVMAS